MRLRPLSGSQLQQSTPAAGSMHMLRQSLSSESRTVPSQTIGEMASHKGRACGCGQAVHDVALLRLLSHILTVGNAHASIQPVHIPLMHCACQ